MRILPFFFALSVVLAAACGVGVVREEPSPDLSELLTWAGFSDTRGLELVKIHEELGLDVAAMFLLRGTAADVDRVLASAHFDAVPRDGVTIYQPPFDDFNPDKLSDVRSAEDRWVNPDGLHLWRQYVRGETADGAVLLHVWAFTT